MIVITRIVLIILGALAGFRVADFYITQEINKDLVSLSTSFYLFCIIAGGGLGYVLGGIIGRALKEGLTWLEGRLRRTSGAEIVIGVIGLIAGLVAAFLVSFGLSLIPNVGPYLALLAFIVMAYLGVFIALRKKDDMAVILRLNRPDLGLAGGKAPRAKIIDTSTIIDGRIIDIYRTGFVEGTLILPTFVLTELQMIADSSDSLRRNRGRRGLDILATLQKEPDSNIEISERDYPDVAGVDSKLVQLAKELDGAILTVDYNLNKVARLQGVGVLNVNELANALKSIVLPGEEMRIRVVREGKESGQGLAYLEDGTMIVVEDGKKAIGKEVDVVVTSALQTPAGRMIFVKLMLP